MVEKTRADYTKANRAAWEASAPLHGTGPDWDTLLADAGKPGFCVLDDTLTDALRGLGIAGKRAAQVGCNNARELLSLAALGAEPVLGIDQSTSFLAQGAELVRAAGLSPALVAADIYDLPEGLPQADLVLITIGVLNWMPDLHGFFSAVASLMAPGARLVIYETHPFLEIFDPDSATPFEPAFSYFERRPQEVSDTITYDGQDHGKGETGYWFIHTLGDIVTAAIGAGLRLDRLTEYAGTIREPEYDIYETRDARIPMSYLMVATKG